MKFKDGVHNIENSVYHASHGVSRSALVEFRRSPYHYWYKYINPDREPETPSPAMKLGELVHTLVLEPETFEKRYIIEPQAALLPRVGLLKDLGREEYEKQKAERERIAQENAVLLAQFQKISEGKEVIKQEVYDQAKAYADAVLQNDIAQSLFTGVKVEQSIYFTHPLTGLQCKVRPDAWLGTVVTDLKTCSDASYYAMQAAAYRHGYFLQAAMTKRALESLGIELEKFVFFCVEKSEAMPVVYYPVDNETILLAEKEFDQLMIKLAKCFDSGLWDAYEVQELRYPRFAKEV